MTAPRDPDRRALARIGEAVRARLNADPAMQRVPVDQAEIYAFARFLNDEECARLMTLIDASAQPSRLYDSEYEGKYRTSYSSDLDSNDSFVRMIERRLADLLGIDPAWGETMQGQRYGPGPEFQAHHDWFLPDAPYWANEERRGGQRSWTVMAYLNDVEDGGATVFEKLGVSVQPQAGALLLWNNMLPDGSRNFDTLHAALPVASGVKYIVTKWFRARIWK